MILNIGNFLKYLSDDIKAQTELAVIGMSGGADSTLVAILLSQAIGKENVFAVHLPVSDTDHFKFNKNSVAVAKRLGISSLVLPIGELNKYFCELFHDKVGSPLSQINMGNLRARLRMISLYSVAKDIQERRDKPTRVVGTGNLSEIYIGYDTKGGDTIADYFPIGELFKSEVYQLLDYFAAQGLIDLNHIDRTPSAGLWEGQSDEDELGYNYDEMEKAIRKCNSATFDLESADQVCRFVYQRHTDNAHKYSPPMISKIRHYCD